MKHISTLLAGMFTAFVAMLVSIVVGPKLARSRTSDVAFTFRMGAGFPGDINRTHPFSVEPALTDTTDVIAAYGNPVLYKTANNSYKGFVAADSTTPVIAAGFLVRPFPTQQSSGGMSSALGSATPPTSGVIDVLNEGYIMSKLPAGVVVAKGGPVYVWFAATAGNNIQGGLVGAASAGNAALITNAKFNGPADAAGNVEVRVWQQG